VIAGSENFAPFGVAFAQALFNGLWVGIAVAAVVHVLLSWTRGLNAATRHAAWYAALVVIAAMPVVSFASSLARINVSTEPAPSTLPAAMYASVNLTPDMAPASPAGNANPESSQPPLWSAALQPVVLERTAIGAAAVLASIAAARITLLIVGLFGLARVKRASRRIDPSLAPTLARTMARDANARSVHVRISETLDAPAAAGFRTPAILLPADLVDTLDPNSLDQIAMHEYAHLRRYDDWTNLAQRFIERLFWFNPAIWFVAGRIDLEREIACDDWAVAGAEGVSGYADCLWHLARDRKLPAFAATAPGAFLTRNQIAARIEHLLQRQRDGAPTLRAAKLFALAPVLVAAIALIVGSAPAIAVRVPAPSLAQANESMTYEFAYMQYAHVVTHVPPDKCPLHTKTTTLAGSAVHATIAATVQAALDTQRVSIARTVRQAIAAQHVTIVAETATIREAVRSAMHEQRHRIEQTVRAATAPSVIAAASETDNLSYGPVDRNLLAHCTGCDLSGKNLRNADLHDLALTGDDLSGADLRGANLRNTVLTGVDLTNAKLDGADLRNAVLTGSTIDGATFAGAKTDGIRLVGMQLTNAILSVASARSLLSACAGCDLSDLDLRGRDLHGIQLDGADLHGTDFSGANLAGARFNGVDLSGVKFDGTNLTNSEFNGCDLHDVDLSRAQTQGIKIQGSTLGSNGNP
jgi:uncharacterized protein YjbI with pentapeptide repeats/beta-lactamase regulating signal transducer with metallopeptidase domain